MNYWKKNGAPAEKLIIGFPAYGHNFILRDASNNGIGAPTSGAGPAGPYTREAGFWAYYEVGRLGCILELWECHVLGCTLALGLEPARSLNVHSVHYLHTLTQILLQMLQMYK